MPSSLPGLSTAMRDRLRRDSRHSAFGKLWHPAAHAIAPIPRSLVDATSYRKRWCPPGHAPRDLPRYFPRAWRTTQDWVFSQIAKRLRTEMSSSTSSQWIPTPRPIRRQLERCLGEALNSRGNHSSGAETRRASASVTMSSSSVNETSTASATGLLAKVLIPFHDAAQPNCEGRGVRCYESRGIQRARLA